MEKPIVKVVMLKGEKGNDADWGGIGGDISLQDDLQAELEKKMNNADANTISTEEIDDILHDLVVEG